MKLKISILLFAVLSAFSCGNRKGGSAGEADSLAYGDTIEFRYARLLTVVDHGDYREVTIANPWHEGKVLHRYLLVPATVSSSEIESLSKESSPSATIVRVPLRRSMVFSSVHCALAAELNAASQVAGVADSKYIKVEFVKQGLASGSIIDCGDGMNPMTEKIIDAGADAILLSPFENSGGYGQLEDISIPLVECAEYMEQSPLARAEWIRFYGMLYGREREADSIFAAVDSCYQALRAMVNGKDNSAGETSQHTKEGAQKEEKNGRPGVLVDKQTGSVWYVPGGRSTIGQMLGDAGADYAFARDEHSGSVPLPFETILERQGDADVWLFRYDSPAPMTLSKLAAEQRGYSQLKPFKTGEVYGCNVTTSMFYEESPFHPERLLSDFIKILHPDLLPNHQLRYYHKVE